MSQLKNILENKRLKSFLSFQNNISNTIAELKKKDFSFNEYKINTLLYIIIIYLIFSSFGNGSSNTVKHNCAENQTYLTGVSKDYKDRRLKLPAFTSKGIDHLKVCHYATGAEFRMGPNLTCDVCIPKSFTSN